MSISDPKLDGPLHYWGKCYRDKKNPKYVVGCNDGALLAGQSKRVSELPLEMPTGEPHTVHVKLYSRPGAENNGIGPRKGTAWKPFTSAGKNVFRDNQGDLEDVFATHMKDEVAIGALRAAWKPFAERTPISLERKDEATAYAQRISNKDSRFRKPFTTAEDILQIGYGYSQEINKTPFDYGDDDDGASNPFNRGNLRYYVFENPETKVAIFVESVFTVPELYREAYDDVMHAYLNEGQGDVVSNTEFERRADKKMRAFENGAAIPFYQSMESKQLEAVGWKYSPESGTYDKTHRVMTVSLDRNWEYATVEELMQAAAPIAESAVLWRESELPFKIFRLLMDGYHYVSWKGMSSNRHVSKPLGRLQSVYTGLSGSSDTVHTWKSWPGAGGHMISYDFDEPFTVLADGDILAPDGMEAWVEGIWQALPNNVMTKAAAAEVFRHDPESDRVIYFDGLFPSSESARHTLLQR